MKKRIGAALLSFAMLAALFVPSVIPARAEADNAITPVLTTTPAPTATATAAPAETAAPTTTVTTTPGETAAPSAQTTETAAPSASPETSESPAPSAAPAQCTCGAAEGEAHKEGCPLYVKLFDASSVYGSLMACATADEMDAILATLTEEQLAQFTDEQKAALEEHYQSLKGEEEPDEEGLPIISYTDVGPLLAAPAMPRLLRARALVDDTTDNGNGNGVVLNKKADKLEDNSSYKITMEAYATGESTTTVSTEPVDIVLVLDVSGSMDDPMYTYTPVYKTNLDKKNTYYIEQSGKYQKVEWDKSLLGIIRPAGWYTDSGKEVSPKTSENDTDENNVQFYERVAGAKKMAALKTAVNGFIDNVAEKSSNSQIAIVKFAGNKREDGQVGNDFYNQSGWRYNYSQIVKKLTTVNEPGKTSLKNAINSLSPAGATAADYGMELAKSIISADDVVDDGHKKVVIMFTDGEPTRNSEFENSVANSAINASHSIKAIEETTVYTIGVFGGADGTPVTDLNSLSNVNKYMHLVSSNYKEATSMNSTGDATYPADGKSYFLSAGSSADLNSIFQQISQEVGGSTTTLDKNAVIKDIVTPYFTMPANTESVTVKTAESDGSTDNWKEAVAFNGEVTINPEDNSVSVRGFSFKDNWCGTHTENGVPSFRNGKKLIIEFEVKVKDGFLGGNNVPTNGEQSGIYENSSASEPIQKFDVPTVNVPIPEITITAEDKNVYLLHKITEEECLKGATITCNGVNLLDDKQYTGDNAWKAAFVKIIPPVITKPADGLTEDGKYTLKATIEPSQPVTNGVSKSEKEEMRKINVFKPELTFKDSQIDLGETADYEAQNRVTSAEVWKHGDMSSDNATMIGTKPDLALSYNPIEAAFKQDTPVKVTVKIGENDVSKYTTFKHDDCGFEGCTWDGLYAEEKDKHGEAHFIVHVKSFDLTIKKEGWKEIDENQSFVFRVTKNDDSNFSMDVVIHGDGQVTIKGLKPGTYTVTEKTGWSWRYTPTDVSQQVNPATATEKDEKGAVLVTFTNTREKIKWLNGSAWCKNLWGTSTPSKSN